MSGFQRGGKVGMRVEKLSNDKRDINVSGELARKGILPVLRNLGSGARLPVFEFWPCSL